MTTMTQMNWVEAQADVAPNSKDYLNFDDNQDNLIRKILKLYNRGKGFDLDPMFGKGTIHKNISDPRFKFDAVPRAKDVEKADARRLPLDDESVESVLLDPPFLSGDSASGVMVDAYTKCKSEVTLRALYRGIIDEMYRVLKRKGILVFKCQDCISGGDKRWNADAVRRYGEDAGFVIEDTAYLLRYHPMDQGHRGPPQHLRSAVIQFVVMRKGSLTTKEKKERAAEL